MKLPEEPESTRAETEIERSWMSSFTDSRDNVAISGST